jgi:hypothetical protein
MRQSFCDDPALVLIALGDVARAGGMPEIARELSEGYNPSLHRHESNGAPRPVLSRRGRVLLVAGLHRCPISAGLAAAPRISICTHPPSRLALTARGEDLKCDNANLSPCERIWINGGCVWPHERRSCSLRTWRRMYPSVRIAC